MMNHKKTIQATILSLVLANLFLGFQPQIAFAQSASATPTQKYKGVQDQVRDFLCTPSDASKDPTASRGDLYNCINKIYRFALVIVSIFAVFMIVIGAYVYMSAEGNEEAVSKAKDILVTSIASIIILSSGYILLRFLNPDLIKFQPIQPESVVGKDKAYSFSKLSASQLQSFFEGTGGVDKAKIGAFGIAGCGGTADGSACEDYSKRGLTGNRSQINSSNTFLSKGLVNKLVATKQRFSDLVINEAYPPTGDHASACHNNGTCADIGVSNKTGQNVDALCAALKQSGITNIINEYTEFSSYQFQNCPRPQSTTFRTGGHLHVQ